MADPVLKYSFKEVDFFTASDGTRNVKNLGTGGTAYDGVLYTGQGLDFVQNSNHNRVEFSTIQSSDLSTTMAALFVDCTCHIDNNYPNAIGHGGYGSEPQNNRINIGTELKNDKGYNFYVSDGTNLYMFDNIIPYAAVKDRHYKILGQVDATNGVIKVWTWENGVTTLAINDTTTWLAGTPINTSVPYKPLLGNLRDSSLDSVTWDGLIRGGAYFNCIFTQTEVEEIFNHTEKFYDYVRNGNDHGIFTFDRTKVLFAVPITEGQGSVAYNCAPNGIGNGALVNMSSTCWTNADQDAIGDQNCRYKLDANGAFIGLADEHTIRWDN